MDKYETVKLQVEVSSLGWWASTGKPLCGLIFPVARQVLAMEAATCESERAFSHLRRILRWDRTVLDSETVKRIATVGKNWDMIKSYDSLTQLTEAEARKEGVGRQLRLGECLSHSPEESDNVLLSDVED